MATKRRTPQKDILHRLSGNRKSGVQTPLTARRYTPYTKSNQRSKVVSRTPLPSRQQKQRTRDGGPLRKKNGRNESSEGLSAVIVGKTWKLHRASPFYCLKLDKKSLQNYERRLNAWLLRESDSRNQTKSRIKTSFRKVDGDSAGEYGVEIKVYSGKGKEDTQKDSPDLIAVLCCGRIDEETNREDEREKQGNVSSAVYGSSEFISLPVVLMKGPVLLKESFLQWLEGQFGCKVSPMLLSPMDLAWLVSLCSGIGEPLHSTELTYHVPAVVPGLDTICFTIAAKDAKLIWDAVHDSTVEFFTNEEALKFLKSLESHFYRHFKIHLDQMQLSTIATSVAFVGKEGRVKILQKNYVCYILQQFVQVSNMVQMPI